MNSRDFLEENKFKIFVLFVWKIGFWYASIFDLYGSVCCLSRTVTCISFSRSKYLSLSGSLTQNLRGRHEIIFLYSLDTTSSGILKHWKCMVLCWFLTLLFLTILKINSISGDWQWLLCCPFLLIWLLYFSRLLFIPLYYSGKRKESDSIKPFYFLKTHSQNRLNSQFWIIQAIHLWWCVNKWTSRLFVIHHTIGWRLTW